MTINTKNCQSFKPSKLGQAILKSNLTELYRDTDRMFVVLLGLQWILAVSFAACISPFTWVGSERSINVHLTTAVFLGGILTVFPIWVLRYRSGTPLARYIVSVTQALWSILLIHLTGGRIETHFHIFGSLAFIAFYRDWKLLVPMTLIVGASHLVGVISPSSAIYDSTNPEWWRFLEHLAWVLFEDVFLTLACIRSFREMQLGAERQAELENVQEKIQLEVDLKTEELVESSSQKEHLQVELLRAHKLESVGRLASGIAHEINTPIQYVTDSVFFATEGIQELFDLLKDLENLPGEGWTHEQREWISHRINNPEVSYLRDNLPKALERSSDGLSKVSEIVRSMKLFAYPDRQEMVPTDLNESIRTTLVVCRNEYKYLATIDEKFGDIPYVTCHAGEVNQVLTNLIINAAHSISERYVDPSEMGMITIETSSESDSVVIRVSDTGCGIPQENLSRIFEPFFTTKAVGRGTGQGLAIVHSVVVNKLGGTISVESYLNEGTTFTLRLPIEQQKKEAA